MTKHCKKDKSAKEEEAEYICGRCERLARKKDKLCKPEKIRKK